MNRGLASQSQVLGLAIAVVVTTATGGVLLSTVDAVTTPHHPVSVSGTATADGAVTLVHRGGNPVDVRSIRLEIVVGGQRLTHQPPIPFFAASGFRGGPTGPFNSAADPQWTVGETAGFEIASTNAPLPERGQRLVVRVYRSGSLIGVVHTTVTRGSEPE